MEEHYKEEEEYECRSNGIKRNVEVRRELDRLQKIEIKHAEIIYLRQQRSLYRQQENS